MLQFIRDPEITCEVESATKVRFQGEVMSPGASKMTHTLNTLYMIGALLMAATPFIALGAGSV